MQLHWGGVNDVILVCAYFVCVCVLKMCTCGCVFVQYARDILMGYGTSQVFDRTSKGHVKHYVLVSGVVGVTMAD